MFKRVLTIAGSDSGGGAGIQADLKAFENMGVYGMSVITAVTAQNTQRVLDVYQLPAEFVGKQLDAVIKDIGVDAVKIGMLGNAEVVKIVASKINYYKLENVVLDPVMVATSGDPLLAADAIEVIKDYLMPCARIVTPNRQEASILSGMALSGLESLKKAGQIIYDLGPAGVLIKGGDFEETTVTDLYYDGNDFYQFKAEKIWTSHTHGTGCTLSSVIAACLAQGMTELDATKIAREYVYKKIILAQNNPLGHGSAPISLPSK